MKGGRKENGFIQGFASTVITEKKCTQLTKERFSLFFPFYALELDICPYCALLGLPFLGSLTSTFSPSEY